LSQIIVAILAVVTVLALIACLAAPPYIRERLAAAIPTLVVIDSTSAPGYTTWSDTRVPNSAQEYYQLFFFDIQNSDGILRGEIPKVLERGPYSYREQVVKFDPVWSQDRGEMSWRTWTYYVFDEATSGANLTENDLITNVNLPLLGVKVYSCLISMYIAKTFRMYDYHTICNLICVS